MKRNEGFTITELMVALIVGSLVIGFCFTAYLFIQKTYSKWNLNHELRSELYNSVQLIASDIAKSKSVEFPVESQFQLIQPEGKIITYNLDSLTRNGVTIVEGSIGKIHISVVQDHDLFTVIGNASPFNGDLECRISVKQLESSATNFAKEIHL